MIHSYSYFTFFAITSLLMFTYQDLKNKMIVDDRRNAFMMGISISLFSHFNHKFIYIAALVIFGIVINVLMNKIRAFGGADNDTLTWLLLGMGIINALYNLFFLINLTIITAGFFLFKIKIFKIKGYVPYYPVILCAFILTVAMFQIW